MSAAQVPRQPTTGLKADHSSHIVQFYSDDEFLIEDISQLIGTALLAGDAAVLIATDLHREQIERSLRKRGLDTLPAANEDRYVTLDAEETLAALCIDGMVDRGRFIDLIGTTIERAVVRARSNPPRVVVFGEMVALLMAKGDSESTIGLEHLWNELARTHCFSLRCAYPISGFSGNAGADEFLRVCAEHSGIVDHDGVAEIFTRHRQPVPLERHVQPSVEAPETQSGIEKEGLRLLTHAVREHAVMMLDREGCITSWSRGAEHVTGFNASEAVGKHISRFYPAKELRSGDPEHDLTASEREGIFENEGVRIRKDGSAFWARVTILPLRNAAGAVYGYGQIIRDLTETKRAQMALHHSEERFRLLVEAVQDYAIFMLDPEGRVTSWNIGAERMKGYRSEEILGKHFSRFYSQEDRCSGKPQRLLNVALAQGRVEDEGWRVRKDGSKFWANVTITAVRDPGGTLVGFAKVTRDITERMQTARSLQESEERYRTVAETAHDAIVSIDEESRIQFANSATTKMFGYAPSELIGQSITVLMREQLRAAHTAGLRHHLHSGRRRLNWQGVEFQALRKNGDEFPVEVSFGEVAQDGKRRFIGFIRDITERKRAQQKLAASERSLRQLSLHLLRTQDEERRRIGRDLHDSLGQYLAALKMNLDLLGASLASDSDAAASLKECGQLTEESIKEVRTISYLLYPPMLEEIGLKSAIPWYLEGFSQRSGIATRFDVPADFPRLSLDVELAMFRVLQESLTNVHRHSQSPDATVRLWLRDGMAVLEISDNGKGLQAAGLEHGTPDWMGSLGVGLRGMRERMQQLGGTLEVSSGPHGTTVTAAVPCQEGERWPRLDS